MTVIDVTVRNYHYAFIYSNLWLYKQIIEIDYEGSIDDYEDQLSNSSLIGEKY